MTDREAFEAWVSGPPYECEVTRFPEGSAWPGNYQDPSVDLAWFAWQAATPAWHDAPTEPGLWVLDDGTALVLESGTLPKAFDGLRWYGPIPQDGEKS